MKAPKHVHQLTVLSSASVEDLNHCHVVTMTAYSLASPPHRAPYYCHCNNWDKLFYRYD